MNALIRKTSDTRTEIPRPTHTIFPLAAITVCLLLLRGFLPLLGLRAQALLLLSELERELGPEVFRLEHLANLDLRLAREGIRTALDPFDRLLLRLYLPQPEAGDQLLRLGERPVDHGALVSREFDARALRSRLEPLGREQHSGFRQLLVVLPHRGQELLVRHDARFRVLGGFDNNHESHRSTSLPRHSSYCFRVYVISIIFISLPFSCVPYMSNVWVLLSTIFHTARCVICPPPSSACCPFSVMVLPSALAVPSIVKIPVPMESIHIVT